MSSDAGGSGRYEQERRPIAGHGMPATAQCDECQRKSANGRRQAKVLKGPLRGIRGMVCITCLAERAKVQPA